MNVKEIKLSDIKRKENYRLTSSETDVSDLMGSIKSVGLLEPVIVKALKNGKYELTAGFRRYNAVKKLGIKTIPASIYSGKSSNTMINLTENLIRKDATAYEVGRGIYQLKTKEKMSNSEIAVRLGLANYRVGQYLDLYNDVPAKFRNIVRRGKSNGKGNKGFIPNDTAHNIIKLRKGGFINKTQTVKLLDMAKSDDTISNGKIRTMAKALKHEIPFDEATEMLKDSHGIHFNATLSNKDYKKLIKKYGSINQAFISASEKFLKIKCL